MKINNFTGILQVLYKEFWYNVSNYGVDTKEINIICKYFHFNNGYGYKQEKINEEDSYIFSLSCKNSETNLNDCSVENFMEFWLDEIVGLRIGCSMDHTVCSKSKSDGNAKVFNYLNSCYYVYEFNETLSYESGENVCKSKSKNLLGISSQDEARFVENIIISLTLEKKSLKNLEYLLNLKNEWKLPTGTKIVLIFI